MAVFAAMVTRHSDCSCLCSILRPFLLIVNRLLAPAIVHPHRFPKSVFVGTAPMTVSFPSALLAVYKYSRPAYQQAGEPYTPYILHILFKKERHPFGCLRSFVQILPMISRACLRFIAQSSTYSAVCSFNIPPGARDGFVGFPRFNANDRFHFPL